MVPLCLCISTAILSATLRSDFYFSWNRLLILQKTEMASVSAAQQWHVFFSLSNRCAHVSHCAGPLPALLVTRRKCSFGTKITALGDTRFPFFAVGGSVAQSLLHVAHASSADVAYMLFFFSEHYVDSFQTSDNFHCYRFNEMLPQP